MSDDTEEINSRQRKMMIFIMQKLLIILKKMKFSNYSEKQTAVTVKSSTKEKTKLDAELKSDTS